MHMEEAVNAHALPHDDRYRVVAVPTTDTLFRHVVDRRVRLARRRGTPLRAVRRALRRRYPDAELSRQHNCHVQGEQVEVWFAYRDGRAEPITPQHGWWNQPASARVMLDAAGRLTRPNAACRQLLGWPPGNGPMSLRNVLSPELFNELVPLSKRPPGEAWSGSLPLRLPTMRRVDIEFHAEPDAGQRFKVAIRRLADRDRANDWRALRHSAIGSVPAALLSYLFASGTRLTLGSGERLAKSLTDDAWVVLVTAGIVRLYVAMDGTEPTLTYGNSGSLFGTHAFIPDEAMLLGLQAVTPSVVLRLSSRRVEELANGNPAFFRAISGDVRVRLHDVIRSFAERSTGDLRQRLAREILALSDLHADDELVPVTEQQLADGIGSIRESVGRSIGDLRRDGSIATTRHGLLILDKQRLRGIGLAGLS